jgi:hypothetical protein
MLRVTRLAAVMLPVVGLLLLLTAQLPAEPIDPLRLAVMSSGAGGIHAVRFSGVGTLFAAAPASAPGASLIRMPLQRYDAEVDYPSATMREHLTRVPSPDPATGISIAPAPADVVVTGRDGMEDLVPQAWLTPHGFLKAARRHRARVRRLDRETEVSFEYRGQRIVGYLDQRYQVDRVQTWERGAGGTPVLVETRYRDYEPMWGGGRFPRHIIRTHDGQPTLDVWVWAARANPPARAQKRS